MPPDVDSVPAEEIRGRLEELATSIDKIPTLANSPETTLSILGKTRTEAYWEALLEYFLDPEAPHGFDTDVLEAFLTAVSEESKSSLAPRAYQLSEIQIASQVGADDGVPDILVWIADEWFCCIELKSHSKESDDQTIRYASSTSLGPLHVSDFSKTNRHYIYLAPASTSVPTSEDFVKLDWEDVVPYFGDVLSTGRGRYPSKSQAQLFDFVDTLEDELEMTDYKEYERDKVELAIEYGPEIQMVISALQDFVEQERNSWQEDFLASAPEGWDTDLGGQIHPRLFHQSWLFDETGRVDTEEEADLVLNYVSKINEENLLNRNLTVEFKRRSDSDKKLEEKVYDKLYAEETQTQLRNLAEEHNITLADRTDGVHIFQTPVPLDIDNGDTIGGRFAERIREIQPVNEVINQALLDIDW